MSRVIALANQKGGVGKTTSAVNLGAYLAKAGHSVLLIDFDPQGNATTGLGFDKRQAKPTLYDVLSNDVPIESAVKLSEWEGLSLIPVDMNMVGLQISLVDMEKREFRLRQAMAPIRDRYEFILIDCPPSLGLLTLNAVVAADSVLIPLQCEFFALEGVVQLKQTIEYVKKLFNPSLFIEGVLLTMYDGRTSLGNQVVEEARTFFKEKVYEVMIPRNVRLAEAPSFGRPISEYDATGVGAKAYQALAEKVATSG